MPTSSRFAVAVHILALLALAGDEPVKSESIAASVNTNPVVIRRLLCALARAGLVTSQTGAGGGSRLARAPEEISLLDIYRAVEDRDAFALHRQRPNRRCMVGMSIETVLSGVLEGVNAAMERELAKISVADSVRRMRACARAGRKA